MVELTFRARRRQQRVARAFLPLLLLACGWSLWMLGRGDTYLPPAFYALMTPISLYFAAVTGLMLRNRDRPVVEIDAKAVCFGSLGSPSRRHVRFEDIARVGPLSRGLLPNLANVTLALRSGASARVWLGDLSLADQQGAREAMAVRTQTL